MEFDKCCSKIELFYGVECPRIKTNIIFHFSHANPKKKKSKVVTSKTGFTVESEIDSFLRSPLHSKDPNRLSMDS